jgi:hypothetical protein
MSAIDALLEDINVIRHNMEALHKEVAGLSKRTQEQGKHLSRPELDEVLTKIKEIRYSIPYEAVADRIQPHLTTPAKVDAALMSGLRQLEQMLKQIPRSVPIEDKVWGFTSWRVGAVSIGTPLLLLVLLLWFPGVFSLVPKEQFERVQAQAKSEGARADRLVATGEYALDIARFYDKQIKAYVKKNPKAAVNFPKYVIPQNSQTLQK